MWLQRIELLFLKLDTEPNCDFVTIHNGFGIDDEMLGNFSGNIQPREIVSKGRWMFVDFSTCRFPLHKPGFEVQYRSINDYPRKHHSHKKRVLDQKVCLIICITCRIQLQLS